MKLKGHDGIAVYKSLHISADFIGNFPKVGETHVDGTSLSLCVLKTWSARHLDD